MEFENIRAALEYLLEINNQKLNPARKVGITDENGTHWRKETYGDLQDLNTAVLAYIADVLGMSDLYLKGEVGQTLIKKKEE